MYVCMYVCILYVCILCVCMYLCTYLFIEIAVYNYCCSRLGGFSFDWVRVRLRVVPPYPGTAQGRPGERRPDSVSVCGLCVCFVLYRGVHAGDQRRAVLLHRG